MKAMNKAGRATLILGLTGLALACGGPVADDSSGSPTDDTQPATGAPEILSFGTNVTDLTDTDSVVVTAVVTHPQGIEQVIGGNLLAPSGNTYGAFSTGAEEGAYTYTLTWNAVSAEDTLIFEDGEEPTRTVTAEFYDQAGNKVTETVTLSFYCPDGEASCDGECISVLEDLNNCGTCGNVCDAYPDECIYGACVERLKCVAVGDATTCGEVCTDNGYVDCIDESNLSEFGSVAYGDADCDNKLDDWWNRCESREFPEGTVAARCYCQ